MSNPFYVDGIKVKISEHYKPPYRISLPFTYSQRLNQNKQILASQSDYDFSLEESCLQKMTELQHIKSTEEKERRERLEEAKKEYEERCEIEEKQREEAQAKILEESVKNLENAETTTTIEPISYPNTENNQTYSNSINDPSLETNYSLQSSRNYQNYVTNGILMPTLAPTYSNILTPVPLSANYEPGRTNNNNRKLFNLSDFEADTSSPFDNMELKSINDLEELAQVLKSDRSQYPTPNISTTQINQYPNQYSMPSTAYNITTTQIPTSRYPPSSTQVATSPPTLNHIPVHSSYSQYNYVGNTGTVNYVPTTISTYSHLNGYYYSSNLASQTNNYDPKNTYGYNTTVQPSTTQNPYLTQSTLQNQMSLCKSSASVNSKSVPDIMQSLEDELAQVNLRSEPSYVTNHVPTPTRPKSIDTVYRKMKKKENLLDPMEGLSEEQRHFCQSISSMGFPIDRVVRVRKIVGDDYKKVVDHLLALSDLLDLGFPEKDASGALFNSNNDRDKALDSLIS